MEYKQTWECANGHGNLLFSEPECLECSRKKYDALSLMLTNAAKSVGCTWHFAWHVGTTPAGAKIDVIKAKLCRDGAVIHTRMGKDHQEAGERLIESIGSMHP